MSWLSGFRPPVEPELVAALAVHAIAEKVWWKTVRASVKAERSYRRQPSAERKAKWRALESFQHDRFIDMRAAEQAVES